MKHSTGAIKDTVDERDYQWSRVATGTNLFDWDAGFDVETELSKKLGKPFKLPSKDQGKAGSCGGQAWSYYGAVLEALITGTYEERSAKFIYSQTVVPPAGSNGRPNCEVCINQGWALETDTPSYENGRPPSEAFMQRMQDITTKARNNASYSKALVYANVNPSIDLIANAVKANYGAVIGIEGADNGTWLSKFPAPPTKTSWAHWIYCFKAISITPTELQGWKDGIINYDDLKKKYGW